MFVNFLKFIPSCHIGNIWDSANLLIGSPTAKNPHFCKLSSAGNDCPPLASACVQPCICLAFPLWLSAPLTFRAQWSSRFFSSNLDHCINSSNRQTQNTFQHKVSTFKIREKSELLRKGELFQGGWEPFAKSAALGQKHMAQEEGFTAQLLTPSDSHIGRCHGQSTFTSISFIGHTCQIVAGTPVVSWSACDHLQRRNFLLLCRACIVICWLAVKSISKRQEGSNLILSTFIHIISFNTPWRHHWEWSYSVTILWRSK